MTKLSFQFCDTRLEVPLPIPRDRKSCRRNPAVEKRSVRSGTRRRLLSKHARLPSTARRHSDRLEPSGDRLVSNCVCPRSFVSWIVKAPVWSRPNPRTLLHLPRIPPRRRPPDPPSRNDFPGGSSSAESTTPRSRFRIFDHPEVSSEY